MYNSVACKCQLIIHLRCVYIYIHINNIIVCMNHSNHCKPIVDHPYIYIYINTFLIIHIYIHKYISNHIYICVGFSRPSLPWASPSSRAFHVSPPLRPPPDASPAELPRRWRPPWRDDHGKNPWEISLNRMVVQVS